MNVWEKQAAVSALFKTERKMGNLHTHTHTQTDFTSSTSAERLLKCISPPPGELGRVHVFHQMFASEIAADRVRLGGVRDRWAPRPGHIHQPLLSRNSAGLSRAGVHELPLICHRGLPNGHDVSLTSQ